MTVSCEEVNVLEQLELGLSNPYKHGMENRIYLLQRMHCLWKGMYGQEVKKRGGTDPLQHDS
jgi:hypothetical protein